MLRGDTMKSAAIAALSLAILAGFAWLIVWAIKDHNEWEKACTQRGGHVDKHTDWHTSYDAKGNSHTDSNTTYYCLGPNGEMWGIR